MKISLYLALSLIIVGVVFGLTIGYFASPEYKPSMFDKNEMSLGPADKTFDLRYINAMIAHHKAAMLLAEKLDKKTTRTEMKNLAQNILANEPKAIAELYDMKKEWYKDTRPVFAPLAANLGPADEKFDLRFLNALIFHHEEGITMTKETRLKSSRAEILNNADTVEAFLLESLQTLKLLRSTWYNI